MDGARTWLSNGNLCEPFMSTERNFEVFDDDPQDAEDLQEVFDADWERRSADLDCTRLVVSPENAHERILDLIDSARNTLVIESMQFRDTDVREHVAARIEAGVTVRVLLANPDWIDDNFEAAEFLMDFLKTRAPFWKKEHLSEGGDGGWVAARAADDDAAGRWRR